MNYAHLSKSPRLQRVLKLLKGRKAYSTMQIIKKANVCAVSAIASELRAQGYLISCQRTGNKWMYWLN